MPFKTLDVICHLPWRSPRQTRRRVLILPDGNGRTATNLEGYAAGADNVVACAEYFAQRGDVDTLVMCIVSDLNAHKRDDRFFQVVSAQFARLGTNIATKGHLLRGDIRCRAAGEIAALRAMGGARATLMDEAEGVCNATNSVSHPRMNVEFWFAYSNNIAWQTDVDIVIRTGAEESSVVRPGLSLPPNVPCVVTPTLWPDAKPSEIGTLVDSTLRHQAAQFARGYDIEFVEKLLYAFSAACIPAPVHMTIPVCAPELDVLLMLQRVYGNPQNCLNVATKYRYSTTNDFVEYGPKDDVWYTLSVVPASQWHESSRATYHAIVTPGQSAGSVQLVMPAGFAHVHSCASTVDDVLTALRKAVRFSAQHVLLHGADRAKANELAVKSPWPADLMELMHDITRVPDSSVEQFVHSRLPTAYHATVKKELLMKSISAKVLGQALRQGLLLPDEPVRQSDRNYAYTGAYMMLRIADEGNVTGLSWEPAAEIAIQCMLAISTGDNGIFDRMYPGETPQEWRERLELSARYLTDAALTDVPAGPTALRGSRLLQAIAKQWQDMLAPRANTSAELVHACRDALLRHYLANRRERDNDVINNPLVHWLCVGGLPRRDAMQKIEERYAQATPSPIAEKIRALLNADVAEPNRFHSVRREMQLVLHLVDTAHSIAVEVLFLCCALTLPKESITPERLQALIVVGQVADYAFRLANDLASLNDAVGGDQDETKESSLSILIPKISNVSERAANMRMVRELGATTLSWLEEHLRKSVAHLHTLWPSMATKVMRAIRVGRSVYAEAHYTTLPADAMMTLLHKLDTETNSPVAPDEQVTRQTTTRHQSRQRNRLHTVISRVAS